MPIHDIFNVLIPVHSNVVEPHHYALWLYPKIYAALAPALHIRNQDFTVKVF
jgi:hypothetical protein